MCVDIHKCLAEHIGALRRLVRVYNLHIISLKPQIEFHIGKRLEVDRSVDLKRILVTPRYGEIAEIHHIVTHCYAVLAEMVLRTRQREPYGS